MTSNWSSLLRMRFWCASLRKESDVLPSLQNGGDSAPTGVGDGVSADAVFADVLLQLLVGVAVADHCAFVESRQLRPTAASRRLLADAVALDVDCRARDGLLSAAGVSAGIFSFLLCGQEKRSALSTGDHSAVGQLPGAGLCVEDDSGLGRRAEYSAAVCAPDQASAGVSAVQPVCRGADADAHLHSVCLSADLRGARAHSAQSGGSVA